MVISKILEQTLTAGATSVVFTDAEIPNSLIRITSNDTNLIYESVLLVSNSLTITYPAQETNKSIAIELVKAGLSIIDNLTSDDDTSALSAKQGKTLKGLIDNLPAPITELTSLDDVEITELTDGQILAYDELSEKFVNVDQSTGGGGVNYSTTEQDTGLKWLDGKTIYQKTFQYHKTNILANSNFDVSSDLTGVDEVITYQSRIKYAVDASNIGEYYSDDLVRLAKTSTSTYKIFLTIGQATFATADIDLTVLYTKTS